MAGWRSVYAPRAVGYHHHSVVLGHASSAKYYLVGRNRVRMLAKNATTARLRRRALEMVVYDCAYVLYAGVRDRTLAPLRGRVRGLIEWRSYRAAGPPRREVGLSPRQGLRGALARNRVYRSAA
jgi:GT2 family glycosyltransferase